MQHSVYKKNLNIEQRRSIWLNIVEDFMSSELSQSTYARRCGLRSDHLSYYYRKYKVQILKQDKNSQPQDLKVNSFIPVKVIEPITAASSPEYTLILACGSQLKISTGFNSTELSLLINTLRSSGC